MAIPHTTSSAAVRQVRFAENAVSAVYHVDQRTDAENMALFYQAMDEQRSRSEVELEKLEASLDASSSDELQKLMDLFLDQFKIPASTTVPHVPTSPIPNHQRRVCSQSFSGPSPSSCARIA